MKLPETNAELAEIFRKASLPDVSEFRGEYLVDVLTGFPSFKRFSHRKVFYPSAGRVSGHNVLFKRKWGHFFTEEGVCESAGLIRATVINYDRKENSFPVRGIRDYVRCVEKDVLYIGRSHYLIFGRLYFMGYFLLEKIK